MAYTVTSDSASAADQFSIQQVLRTSWATWVETAALICQGVTRPVLLVWALLLVTD